MVFLSCLHLKLPSMSTLSFVAQFREYFPFYRLSVIRNCLLVKEAILTSKSCNSATIKDQLGSLLQVNDRQPGSHYKRLLRFF